ncbi:MAG TPA: cob(I)yrinic acid a,c-diamide adenosyltransferase [Candidatus Polarisedimenticolia bacterium]|nr:cob(I)yrinic acid a,c-diamide adenosyltransferase [Candidatus Polarisedimenticolia bacterium]
MTPAGKTTGLVIVHTGNGKGKTTAALGLALRAVGHDFRVIMIQFVKGTWHTGELDSAKRLAPHLEILTAGRGFYKILDDQLPPEEHRQAAREGLALAREKMKSGDYKMVILDEVNVAVSLGLLSLDDLLALVDEKPPDLHLVLTGRGAVPDLITKADLVTEMVLVKHPYDSGVDAQKGVDF